MAQVVYVTYSAASAMRRRVASSMCHVPEYSCHTQTHTHTDTHTYAAQQVVVPEYM